MQCLSSSWSLAHTHLLSLSLAACAERVGEEEKRVLLPGLTRKTRGLRFLPLRFFPWGGVGGGGGGKRSSASDVL